VTSDGSGVASLRERADSAHVIPMEGTVSLLSDLRALGAWVRLLRHIKPVVVFGGSPKAALLSMFAARFTRVLGGYTPWQAYVTKDPRGLRIGFLL
jgi:hypothetical protein